MRLAAKLFLSASLAILGLAAVAAWSLLAVGRLVEVNRAIVTRTVPALRLEASLRESMVSLIRLDTRYAVLHDATYESLWDGRAARTAQELDRLRGLLTTQDERRQHRKSTAAFRSYRQRAPSLRVRGGRRRPAPEAAAGARADGARAQRSLERLAQATDAALSRSQAAARRLERRTWSAVLAALAASVLAALAGAGVLAYRMTRALRRLSTATSELAQGAFTGPVRIESHDEIGELAEAFNHMAARLREADRLKEEFFTHISHELRTPLTAVREAVHLLRDRVPGPLEPRQARLVEIMDASTERVLRLVNQILELSRLQAGLLAIDRRWVDLDKLAARALQELRPQAEARGVTLAQHAAGPSLGVLGDEERLLQVLVNLVGNAIKFTPADGAVHVRLATRGEEVEITVEDTGVGIPAEVLPRIFERYWQARGGPGGTGLGLAIVRGIVEAHGGRVSAESHEGAGSRFMVRMPRKGTAA